PAAPYLHRMGRSRPQRPLPAVARHPTLRSHPHPPVPGRPLLLRPRPPPPELRRGPPLRPPPHPTRPADTRPVAAQPDRTQPGIPRQAAGTGTTTTPPDPDDDQEEPCPPPTPHPPPPPAAPAPPAPPSPPTPGGPGTTGTSIRDHAAAYVERGWHVFALSSGKTPLANCARCRAEHTTPEQMEACTCLTCHGFYSATTDMDRVDAMFMAHPDRLLAIRTGATSGIVVVDIDGPEGAANAQRLAAQGLLRPTLTAQTGSGGAHLVYTHPGGRIQSGAHKIAPSIDSKADGGYIVAPPSIHP